MTAEGLEHKFKFLETRFKKNLEERPTMKDLEQTFKEITDKLGVVEKGLGD
jgi:hypothetical protein